MIKRVLSTLIIVFIFLGLFSCNNANLKEYKELRASGIEGYAISKGKTNYSDNGWIVISNLVIDRQSVIMSASSKAMVDTLVKEAIELIDKVDNEGIIEGKLYSLNEAYNQEFLTVEELRNIAHYHNNRIPFPEIINPNFELSIREAGAESLRNDNKHPVLDAIAERIIIEKYYGIYNGSFVVMLDDYKHIYAQDYRSVSIAAGVQFLYHTPVKIQIWRYGA